MSHSNSFGRISWLSQWRICFSWGVLSLNSCLSYNIWFFFSFQLWLSQTLIKSSLCVWGTLTHHTPHKWVTLLHKLPYMGNSRSSVKQCDSIEEHVWPILKFKSVNILDGKWFWVTYLGRNNITGTYINCLKSKFVKIRLISVYLVVQNLGKYFTMIYHVNMLTCLPCF